MSRGDSPLAGAVCCIVIAIVSSTVLSTSLDLSTIVDALPPDFHATCGHARHIRAVRFLSIGWGRDWGK